MGFYINSDSKGRLLPQFDKATALVLDGAVVVTPEWQENLICIVETDLWDAAEYAYNEREFEYFKREDGRPKIWLTHPLAKKLSGFEE